MNHYKADNQRLKSIQQPMLIISVVIYKEKIRFNSFLGVQISSTALFFTKENINKMVPQLSSNPEKTLLTLI